jgi:hypothetical protein
LKVFDVAFGGHSPSLPVAASSSVLRSTAH